MTEDTPEGRESQQPGDTGLPPWTSLTDLYLMGATSPNYPSFPSLVNAWLPELNRVVPPTYGRKVAGELAYPPDHDRGQDPLSVRLDNGQVIELRFGAFWDAPRRTLDKGPECLDGAVLQGQATAAVQALNCLARVLELQRRWQELGEIEERLDALEQRLEGPRRAS